MLFISANVDTTGGYLKATNKDYDTTVSIGDNGGNHILVNHPETVRCKSLEVFADYFP